jgi:hypothetical protein
MSPQQPNLQPPTPPSARLHDASDALRGVARASARQRKAGPVGEVDILTLGNIALVMVVPHRPANADDAEKLIPQLLSVRYHQFFTSDSGEICWRWQWETFHEDADLADATHPMFRIDSGLVSYITRQLQARGYRVTASDETQIEVSEQHAAEAMQRLHHRGLIQAVTTHVSGQIVVASEEQAIDVIDTLLTLYPDRRPILLTATRDEAQRLADRLTDRMGEDWRFPDCEATGPGEMPIICANLPGGGSLPHHQLVLLYGWRVAMSKLARETAASTPKALRFAIVIGNKPAKLSLREELRLAAISGGMIYDSRTQHRH